MCTTDSMIWNFMIPHIHKWQKEGYYVDCVASKTGFYFNELKNKYNLNISELNFTRSPYNFKNLNCLIKLHRLIRNNNYSLVICQEPVGGALGRLATLQTNTKVIYTAHGFHFYQGAPLLNWLIYYPVEKILAHFTDVLITTNTEDYNRSLAFKAKRKVLIKGVGIDLTKFTFDFSMKNRKKQELLIPTNSKVILTVAELIERKNIVTCIKAFYKIKTKNCFLVICGEGPLKEELLNLSISLGIEKKVIFLGFRKDLNEIYKIADVFFFPSFQEGLSVALLDAMASGLPIVCSNIRGNSDLVQNELGGYLCNPTDFIKFADCLDILLNKNNEKIALYNANVANKYGINEAVNFMLSIIEDTIKG